MAGASIERRALEWLLSGDTGVSSESLCAHMLGIEKSDVFGMGAPSDAADRGRCIRLLNLIPEWWNRLDEMTQYQSREYVSISKGSIETKRDGWAEQILLIKEEAK